MTKPLKVLLLSGLVFPGIGHLVLKYYLRGSVFDAVGVFSDRYSSSRACSERCR